MDPKWIINRQGKDLILYHGLLDQAHKEGLKRTDVQVLQFPSADNNLTCICRAEVETEKGVFVNIGDANPENVGRMIIPHIIRMSATRALARAMRDALNIGMLTADELPDIDDEPAERTPIRRPASRPPTAQRPPTPRLVERAEPDYDEDPSLASPPGRATKEQIGKIHNLRKVLGISGPEPSSLSLEDAASEISSMVKAFNKQAAQKSGNTQRP